MTEIGKNIALGAAAVGAGAVLVGATLLSPNSNPLTASTNGSGAGGTTVSVTIVEPKPEVEITNPTSGDVFLKPEISVSTNFKETTSVGYSLTAPNGKTCELPKGEITSGDFTGATNNSTINVSTCEGGKYGVYTLEAYASGFTNVKSSKTFTYSLFSVDYSTFDNNSDPIVIIRYGEGIGVVKLSAYRAGENKDVLGEFTYVVENNEDHADELVLPFDDKEALVGNYVVTATAYKADGSPINSQDVSAATVSTNFDYYGIQ